MNKFKKEAIKKLAKEKEGLTSEEVATEGERSALVTQLHNQLFPEESDFMMDSIEDAKGRRRGKNPRDQAYADKVNAKRKSLGVSPLKVNGMPADKTSVEYVEKITTGLEIGQIKELVDE